jgi:ATP-dependent DNA helicase RecG
VRTTVMADNRREAIVARVAERCRAGGQAYWVCPLIEESEHLDSQAATDTANLLAEQLAPLRVALIHGRMQEKVKQAVMLAFVAGEIDLLVATTVIEVGVDVPNASLMVIENAERLGLSQLHQLRGRVGRGKAQSDCVLLYQGPLSETARHRLQVMRETNDGFVIAEQDLALRGPGEVLGTRQTGVAEFRIADLARDRALLPLSRPTFRVANKSSLIFLARHNDPSSSHTARTTNSSSRSEVAPHQRPSIVPMHSSVGSR